MIYFLQCGKDGPIKIGFTSDSVVNRLRQVKAMSPHELFVIGLHEGDRRKEAELHKHFADFRVRSEWFYPVKPILDHIEAMGGLTAYYALERPDLKAALSMAMRKHWPKDLKAKFADIRTVAISHWLEGMKPIPPQSVSDIEEILSDPRIADLAFGSVEVAQ